MSKIKFSREQLVEVFDLPYEAIEDNIIDTDRWSTIHEIVFEVGGKFYHTTYSCGSTEMQDESPWEYEDEIECIEVHKVEKTVKAWEPV